MNPTELEPFDPLPMEILRRACPVPAIRARGQPPKLSLDGRLGWSELQPLDPRAMAMFRGFATLTATRQRLKVCPLFGKLMRADLARMLGGDREIAYLIEVQCLVGLYHDAEFHARVDRWAWVLMNGLGFTRTRGKSTRPELAAMVEDLGSLLQTLGAPLKREKGSLMPGTILMVLEAVHTELQMRGDPRNEYRRILRLKMTRTKTKDIAEAQFKQSARRACRRVFRGLRLDDDPS